MTVAGTGHRPDKLNNEYINKFVPLKMYSLYGPLSKALFKEIEICLANWKATKVISGLAIGFDQILAHVAIHMDIPLTAAVPFVGQESRWPFATREWYTYLLRKSCEIVTISSGPYSPILMQKRNEWMVDQVKKDNGKLLSVWDGTNGGTKNCLMYANKVLMPEQIFRINPKELWNTITHIKNQ